MKACKLVSTLKVATDADEGVMVGGVKRSECDTMLVA
jgi:hypothetical protein